MTTRPGRSARSKPRGDWQSQRDENIDKLMSEFGNESYKAIREIYEDARRDYTKARDALLRRRNTEGIIRRTANNATVVVPQQVVAQRGPDVICSKWDPFANSVAAKGAMLAVVEVASPGPPAVQVQAAQAVPVQAQAVQVTTLLLPVSLSSVDDSYVFGGERPCDPPPIVLEVSDVVAHEEGYEPVAAYPIPYVLVPAGYPAPGGVLPSTGPVPGPGAGGPGIDPAVPYAWATGRAYPGPFFAPYAPRAEGTA